MTGVTKSFGANRALRGVSLDVGSGEVLALIGENGAGKSTLMKILSGAYRPDAGTMTLDGQPYAPRGPREARAAGVAMIYQELALAPHLSVEANVMLGQELTKTGMIRRREHRRIVFEALNLLEHPDIRPSAIVGELSVGAQQLVEVARAVVSQARVVVFDEPTSSLTERDAERLFALIERLKNRGLAIIYISHFLEEVRRIVRRTTLSCASWPGGGVGQAGRHPDRVDHRPHGGTGPRRALPECPALGRGADPGAERAPESRGAEAGQSQPPPRRDRRDRGAGRRRPDRAAPVDLRAGCGEVGPGPGPSFPEGGGASPRVRIGQGLGFVSEDRKLEGLALRRSIEDNLTYSALRRHARWGWIRLEERRAEVIEWMARLNVRAQGPRPADRPPLSGGNQQKVAIARLLHQDADVLLLDEPTRGIDVGSKSEIYRLIGELAAQGKAILMVSSYLPELFGTCDRIAVMNRGALSEARSTGDWTEHSLMEVATIS